MVDRLGGGGFLALGFEGQARGALPAHVQAGAEAVGVVRAVRQDGVGIGGQEAGAEGCEAGADFHVGAVRSGAMRSEPLAPHSL